MRPGTLGVAAACVLASIATSCDSSGECGPGTIRHIDTCLPYDPADTTAPLITVDPPVRTRQVGNVRLTTNEPATIYYSTDGNPATIDSPHEADQVVLPDQPDNAIISYFAVDLAGNRSVVETRVWQIDRIGPGGPTDFHLVLNGSTRTLTWNAPAEPHLAGMIVARVDGVLDGSPEAGHVYGVGDPIGTGATIVKVVAAGEAGPFNFTETLAAAPGIVRYVGWSEDDAGNYGGTSGDYALVPLGSQTGTLTASGGGVVSITAQPSSVSLGGTATFDAGTGTLTLNLTLTNHATRVLFAPKVLLTNTLATGTWDNSTGTLDTFPYLAYGGAIAPGSTATGAWTISGVTSTDVLSLAVEVRDNPILVGPAYQKDAGGSLSDLVTGLALTKLAPGPRGLKGSGAERGGGLTLDGQLIVGERTSGSVARIDLATGKVSKTLELMPQKANVPWLVLDHSGSTAYALVSPAHRYSTHQGGGIFSFLVRFDTGSMVETGRIDLGVSGNRALVLAPDGKSLAISTGQRGKGVILVDLGRFAIARTVATDTVSNSLAFAADGSSLLVFTTDGVVSYSTSDGSAGARINVPTTNKAFAAAFAADGRLWLGQQNNVLAIDLATGTTTPYAQAGSALAVIDGKVYVAARGSSTAKRLDASGVVETTFSFPISVYGHWLGVSPF